MSDDRIERPFKTECTVESYVDDRKHGLRFAAGLVQPAAPRTALVAQWLSHIHGPQDLVYCLTSINHCPATLLQQCVQPSIQRCLPTAPTLPSHRYTVPSIDFPMVLQTPNHTTPNQPKQKQHQPNQTNPKRTKPNRTIV